MLARLLLKSWARARHFLVSDFHARRADPTEARRVAAKMRCLCDQSGTPSTRDAVEKRLVVAGERGR